jgi:DNA polymerase-3 subunit alpha
MIKASTPFYHLHVHTEYSLQDSVIRIDPLLAKCKDYGMDAVAITDLGNMFGVAGFYIKALKNNIKPVIGCEVYMASGTVKDRAVNDNESLSHLVLLAENRQGYTNLCKLVSIANFNGFNNKPCIDRELLAAHSKGLIGLSGCMKGDIPQAILTNHMEEADAAAQFYLKTLGQNNFFLEIQENGMSAQKKINAGLLDMSHHLSIPLVATNDCHYLHKEDRTVYDILRCIRTEESFKDLNQLDFDSTQLYFKSPEQMSMSLGHFPGAIENTRKIVDRCNVEIADKSFHFPGFGNSKNISDKELFSQKVLRGFEQKFETIKKNNPDINEPAYQDRINYEIKVIMEMGLFSYFLIVADFIEHARKIDIPTGPGRGTSPGSLVAYSMGITAIDPIEHGLSFERFINPQKKSIPEFELDFCMKRGNQVFHYIVGRYGGSEYVSKFLSFSKLRARRIIKKVGAILDLPVSSVDEIADLLPSHPRDMAHTLPDIKKKYIRTRKERMMLETALRLEGLPNRMLTSSVGFVVSDKPLNQYLPLCIGDDGESICQFNGGDLKELNFATFGFLGLHRLTIIGDCIRRIENQGKKPPDLNNLNLNDVKTLALIKQADTEGVFRLEGSVIRKLIIDLEPDSFSEIVDIVPLVFERESDIETTYIRRKRGFEEVIYLFDELEPILEKTYGIILYKEQLMEIAHTIADYCMADANNLCDAICEKNTSLIEDQRQLFISGAIQNNHAGEKADELFDLMVQSGHSIQDRAHCVAYSLISYQTAYLKAHFRHEYMTIFKAFKQEGKIC